MKFYTKAIGSTKWIRITDIVANEPAGDGQLTAEGDKSTWTVKPHNNDDAQGGLVIIQSAEDDDGKPKDYTGEEQKAVYEKQTVDV